MSVAEDLSNEIKAKTGEETIVSDLTYDLRSGSADFVDRMVASTFAGMAMDAIEEGKHGLMTAITEGRYALVSIPDPKLGPRRVEVATMYNTDRYRPTYDHKLGLPIFLHAGSLAVVNRGIRLLFAAQLEAAVRQPARRLTGELRARIRASFDEASADEEHFPSTIDPRIYHVKLIHRAPGAAGRQAGAGRGLRQGPIRARAARRGAGRRVLGPGSVRGNAALSCRPGSTPAPVP